MVDLSRNGGGSEWAEAAARIVSPVPLRSAPVMVMPGEQWVTSWRKLAAYLRKEEDPGNLTEERLREVYSEMADANAF